MEKAIAKAVNLFLEKTKDRSIKIVSHHDTDGITAAAILAKTLRRLNKKFTIKIVKNLEKELVEQLNNEDLVVFLDLGSSLVEEISKLKDAFIIDHHEISLQAQENVTIINPHLFDKEEISAAGLAYLFSKSINKENKDLANLAVVGMVGDMLEREISKINNKILEDAEVIIKKGLLLYPATRPIHKTLEFSSAIFIPGITGNPKGVLSLLREIGIKKENNSYKSLIELSDEELSKLITEILLRTRKKGEDLIGNIYLVKLFNRLEDARELSSMINACSRLGYTNVALSLCLDNKEARTRAETIYADYKQQLVAALNFAENNKIEGNGYIFLNAGHEIRDTIIGTVASILSMSHQYKEGTIIITMSYDKEKLKVSARVAGREGRNVRELLEKSMKNIEGECGGHPLAAGCLFSREKEKEFIDNLTKSLQLEVVKI
jgi:RecJ-like exonuclease